MGGIFLMEGHSEPGQSTGFTNLALLTRVYPTVETPILETIKELMTHESQGLPVREILTAYLNETQAPNTIQPSSSISFWRWGRVSNCIPREIHPLVQSAVRTFCTAFFDRRDWAAISVFGPELDHFWPTYHLNKDFETDQPGLYLIGEGGGHFRGILQSFSSGHVSADRLLAV